MTGGLRILHLFRAPVGGLFRHVRDLVRGQAGLGHEVGVVCDSLTGGEAAAALLAGLEADLALGLHRLPMARLPGLGDGLTAGRIVGRCAGLRPHIVHGHGAKGGAYARLAAARLEARAVYTPHGGSLHYQWASPAGALFLAAERLLRRRTDGLLFVCDYERRTFAAKVGTGGVPARVVLNGLWPEEFLAVRPDEDASDLLYVGELRRLKGLDVLVAAMAQLGACGLGLSASIVGDGPDRQAFEAEARGLGLAGSLRFLGPLPARQAFGRGRLLIVPSRAESFPYIVIEAAAASVPVIASRVGGIPEALGPEALVQPGNPGALAQAIARALAGYADLTAAAERRAAGLRDRLAAERMVEAVTEFYRRLLPDRRGPAPVPNRGSRVTVP